MNKIVFNYLLKNFLKTLLIVVLLIYCFGVILNLFEEIEFFKKYKCKFINSSNSHKYFYTQYNNETFTFHNFYFKHVVYVKNKK